MTMAEVDVLARAPKTDTKPKNEGDPEQAALARMREVAAESPQVKLEKRLRDRDE